MKDIVSKTKPNFIFHLAAQPLVRESYKNPISTWETNVMGTINLLNSIRDFKNCSVVIVTTDKVYENNSWNYSYRENDALGGYDPYSSSKASVELAVKSWRKSFLKIILKFQLQEPVMLLEEVIGLLKNCSRYNKSFDK